MTGKRSDSPLAPNYVPTWFPQLSSPAKRTLEKGASSFERRQATKRKRLSVQSNAVKNKRTTGREAEIDDTEGVDVANNSLCNVYYSLLRERQQHTSNPIM